MTTYLTLLRMTGGQFGSPSYPGHGKITHAQRDGAEPLAFEFGRMSGSCEVGQDRLSNRVSLETHRAEEIACSRHEEKATHLAIHGKQRDREEDDDSPPGERWEIRALRHMFPASTASADSTDDGSALGEAIAALEAAGAESSPDGTDDSDFEEGKSKLPRVGTRMNLAVPNLRLW
ncbi:hypothetical protein GQ600_10885 [Phytophthora cactorum]|nr:hypothetical protein GQ600_10885 [Phytophthora cactorum]